jgi:REP element-mobilizing transposase RayT
MDATGAAHHVIVRGIEGRRIFRDDEDREDFARRLDRLVPELGFLCYAWAFLPNHAHLVLQTGAASVSRLMARLGTGYACRFNDRHERIGHLFQNRFWSRIIEGDSDLLGVVLYVHRNPLEAGLLRNAEALEQFPWCGHGALTGARPPRSFESPRETLALLARDPREAIHRLRHRMAEAAAEPDVPLADGKPAPPEAVQQTRTCPPAIDRLIEEACAGHGVTRASLLGGCRIRNLVAARREVISRAVLEEGFSGRDVAHALGVSEAMVSRAVGQAAVPGSAEAGPERKQTRPG